MKPVLGLVVLLLQQLLLNLHLLLHLLLHCFVVSRLQCCWWCWVVGLAKTFIMIFSSSPELVHDSLHLSSFQLNNN